MNDKYLSVITNFGCHYSCPYCIVKNNHLNIPKTTIHGLNNLFSEIVKTVVIGSLYLAEEILYGSMSNTKIGTRNSLKS